MKINFRNRAFNIFIALTLLSNLISMPVYAMPVELGIETQEANVSVQEADSVSDTISGNDISNVQETDDEEIMEEAYSFYLSSTNEDTVLGEELLQNTETKIEEIVLLPGSPVKLRIEGVLPEDKVSVTVLQGQKGSEKGSTYLFNKEDDWSCFEIVEEPPFFSVEIEEDENDVNTYLTLLPKNFDEKEVLDKYDYFLRVTFSKLENNPEWTYVVTLPVITKDINSYLEENVSVDASMEIIEETTNSDKINEEILVEDVAVESTLDTELADVLIGEDELAEEDFSEENTEINYEVIEGEGSSEEENIQNEEDLLNNTSDEIVSDENIKMDTDEFTGDVSGQNITVNHTNEELEVPVITVSKVTLNKTYEKLFLGEVLQAKVTVFPEGLGYPVIWNSSNPQVAFVDETGKITAISEGSSDITAECEGKTAVMTIEVVTEDAVKNDDAPVDEQGNLIEISDEIWIAGFEKESEEFVYNGEKITQNLRVYHKGTLLKEKTDYTLSYKNHVNASPYNGVKAPSVTITMKGQYSGSRTLYYTILPREIDENEQNGYEQIIYYAKNLKLTAPNVYYGSKKLASNKDFVCDYSTLPENYKKGDSYEEGKEYEYTVKGIGNYTGTFTMKLTILKDKNYNFGNATITLDKKQYMYSGTSLTNEDVKPLTVKIGKKVLSEELYTYEVDASGTGKGYLTLKPTEEGSSKGYRGSKKVEFKVVGDRSLKDVVKGSSWQDSITFSGTEVSKNGGMYQPKSEVLIYQSDSGDEILTEGIDYTVKYSNHKKVGKATVTFTGIGRYTGSYKSTYQIVPNSNLLIEWENVKDNIPVTFYQKGGAKPNFTLKEASENCDGLQLNAKTDYTVKLTNHQKVGTMTCVITGKGNYKGFSHTAMIQVLEADISTGTMVLSDKQYSEKKNTWWKSNVTIKDVNGKKLTAGTDYDRNIIYSYEGMKEGLYPKAGDIVYVTAKGLNNYAGSVITGSYRIFQSKLSGLSIVIEAQEYTGRDIILSKEDIHVYASAAQRKNGQELEEDCYEIIGYSNNLKSGTAKVILRGIGNYGGTRECSFKINKKKYLTTRVTSISLNEKTLNIGAGNTRQLTATVLPEDAINKTVIWSTSNSKVAEVDTEGLVYAKTPGTAKIKALSQDTGKSVTCTVKVSVIPVVSFELSQIELSAQAGESYQLQAVEVLPEDASYQTLKWESSHPEVASVDETGMVSFHKAGMAVIKVYTQDGEFVRKCLVFVNSSDTDELPDGEYLTPQMFRTCEQVDDTEAFNQAISQLSDSCNTLYVPAGTYKIDAIKHIRLKSNMSLIMSENAVLQAINNSDKFYDIIYANNISGVTITGGTIVGERYGHGDTAGEWGMGIGIYDCTDITITNVNVKDCWGDGIYIGSKHEEDLIAGCSQITIKNCDLYNNRRNNLSIVCGDYVTVDACTFRDANGTAPEYGIDIETNNPGNPCEHITISNSLFEQNGQAGMGIVTVANDIKVLGCTINGDFINYAGTNVTLENTVINGEADARIGLILEGENLFNDGTEAADELVATFRPDKENFTLNEFNTDDNNVMFAEIREDVEASFGKTLFLKRLTGGTGDAGYCLDLGEWTTDGSQILEKGISYRFEYIIKGTGQWAVKTDQTAWYPCVPMKDIYSTGMVSYNAKAATDCRILLYATEKTKNMYLYIDSIKIYKVN